MKPDGGFERAFDDAAIGMMMISRQMRVLRANDTACALLGRDAGEVLGRSILDFTHEEDVATSIDWTEAGFQGYERPPLIKRYVRPDGSIVEASVVSVLVQPDGGEPYFFSQMQDVSQQRRAERLARRATVRSKASLSGSSTRSSRRSRSRAGRSS